MDVVIERACGMDVHKDNITACVMTPEGRRFKRFLLKLYFYYSWLTGLNNITVPMSQWKAQVFIGNLL